MYQEDYDEIDMRIYSDRVRCRRVASKCYAWVTLLGYDDAPIVSRFFECKDSDEEMDVVRMARAYYLGRFGEWIGGGGISVDTDDLVYAASVDAVFDWAPSQEDLRADYWWK